MKAVYNLTQDFPKEERYELTCQLRKAVTSILANLAEGTARFSYADKAHKFVIARGESAEVEAFLLISIELGYCTNIQACKAFDLNTEVMCMLSGLIASCKNHAKNEQTKPSLDLS